MIDKTHVLMMTRYNAWQNNQIMDVVKAMDEDILTQEREVFFCSILGTLNHILWADHLWMARWCDDIAPPAATGDASVTMTASSAAWTKARFEMDGRMRMWAQTLSNVDLTGSIVWHSMLLDRTLTQPKTLCITHMLNHQIHHRGQVHAMLTQAGQTAPTTDLVLMPEDV